MKIIKLAFISLLAQLTYSQTPNENVGCGFDLLPQSAKQTNLQFENVYNNNVNTLGRASENTTERILPIVFHIFHKGEPVGQGSNVSNYEIYKTIELLNNQFGNTENNVNSARTNIKFVLATKNANGNCQEGIVRINLSTNTEFVTNGTRMYSNQPGVDYSYLANLSRWDHNQFYNVYVAHTIQGANGYAMMPTSYTHQNDATVMRASVLNTSVFAHEIGHALNLYHTFEGSNGTECPAQQNGCGSGIGDCVADTPPHIKDHELGNDITTFNTCTNDNNSSFKMNTMTYNAANYMKFFTPLQALRMETAFDVLRSNFATNTNPFLNMTTAPTADFIIDGQAPAVKYLCVNNSINLINTSTCFLNTFQQNSPIAGYTTQWEILKNGVVHQTSQITNPTITFTEVGDYTIRLTVTNPAGTNTKTLTNVIKIINQTNTNHCNNVITINSAGWGYSISQVQLGNMVNVTPNGANYYTDFSCNNIALIPNSNTAVLNIIATTPTRYSDTFKVKAYIDFNNNGTFDESELLGSHTVPAGTDSQNFSFNFNIPQNISLNQVYKMRVIGSIHDITTANCTNNQLVFILADVEDYSIIFYDQNLSVQNPSQLNKFTIYPNPTQNIFTINSDVDTINNIQIYDVNGRLLNNLSNLQTNSQIINLSNYNSGVYLVKINNTIHKVIKN